MVKTGEKAPAFTLPDKDGKMVGKMKHHELDAKLKELLGE